MDNTTPNKNIPQPKVEKKPNENVGFSFSSSVKIIDPETGQVLVQQRAD